MRDSATLEQLIILTNLENYNAEMIKDGLPQPERLQRLNDSAISQAKSLQNNPSLKALKDRNLLE